MPPYKHDYSKPGSAPLKLSSGPGCRWAKGAGLGLGRAIDASQ